MRRRHQAAADRKPATLRPEIDDRRTFRRARWEAPAQLSQLNPIIAPSNDGGRVCRPDIIAGFEVGRSGGEFDRRADLAEGAQVVVIGDAVAEIVAHPW